MPKAKVETKHYITVPIAGANGKDNARYWLWNFLKCHNLIATHIEHFPDKIIAVVSKENKFDF